MAEMVEIQKIHEAVLSFLLEKRKSMPEVRFSLRRSNRFDRLEKGYWFYGNENYLAVSFWSGSDWKNKTPNIIFTITTDGKTYLELVASDSEKKKLFFFDEIPKWIPDLNRGRKKLSKAYSSFQNNYLDSLESFISTDKVSIDKAILTTSNNYFEDTDQSLNRIGFINPNDFEIRLLKVLEYRGRFEAGVPQELPNSLRSIHIKNLTPINDLYIGNIPSNTKWILFTGLNGKGKSSILKAITAGLCNNWDYNNLIIKKDNFEIATQYQIDGKVFEEKINNKTKVNPSLLVDGLAAYGSSRQMVNSSVNDKTPSPKLSSLTYSIYYPDGLLLDIEKQLVEWRRQRDGEIDSVFGNVEQRILQIVDLLPDIIPSLVSIKIPEKTKDNVWNGTRYVEEDEFENKLPEVGFDELASGLRSLVAMLGDMMLRLFAQQPSETDPSGLRGIVIIDELDVHLHPVLQKKLPELLTGIFSKVQFVASTHSPIPLLGVPENSIIFKVDRTLGRGVFVERINLDLPNLLPNAILTSPIFGMDELKSSSNKEIKNINVDDHFDEKAFYDLVDKKIDELAKKIK